VREAVRAVGPQRVLYGTDAPYGSTSDDGYDYSEILGWVQRLPCRATEIDRMLGGNVLELLTEHR
jgi:predicted TIM-barrel fold metal-dependent hydrolase